MKICVLGTGYVGLVSGACLADIGHDVVCVDVLQEKVDIINSAKPPIHEEGLEEILERNVGTRLSATTDLAEASEGADIVLICVGTPFDGHHIDLQYVEAAAEQIGALLKERDHYTVVTVKSTVVPGTTMGPVREALERASGKVAGDGFGLGMNPEFLAEGTAVKDFQNPDRIVVGGIDDRSTEQLARVYERFTDIPLLKTRPSTAEMIKYTSNSLLATMISFSNEIAHMCEALPDVDVADVMPGVHQMSHLKPKGQPLAPPVGMNVFLWPGCGFGGSCFPKDVKALIAQAKDNAVDVPLLSAVIDINESQPLTMIEQLKRHVPQLESRRISVLGLAFKPGTDDVRESPALKIVPSLLSEGAQVVCHDPIATQTGEAALSAQGTDTAGVEFTDDLTEALRGTDGVLLVTRWPEYESLPQLLAELQRQHAVIVDGRRLIDASAHSPYEGVGRASQL